LPNLPYDKKIKTLRAIAKLKYEYICWIWEPATAFNTLDFFLASRNGIFITTPEPTFHENVYRLMRAILFSPDSSLFFRDRLQRAGKKGPAAIRGMTLLTNQSILFLLLKKNIRKNTC